MTDSPIRVTIVDDSVVVRGLFSRWLAAHADIEIAGIHRNGLEAVRQIAHVRPDVVILDIEMPEMDGLTALPLLLEASPGSKVLVVSGMSARAADLTLRCIMRGAVDFLAKPSTMLESGSLDDFRIALMERVRAVSAPRSSGRALTGAGGNAQGSDSPDTTAPAPRVVRHGKGRPFVSRPEVIVIGASTGGPPAIAELLRLIGPVVAVVPVVVAQQMPASFSSLFADLIARQSGLATHEIGDGGVLAPGMVHICRGGSDLILDRDGGHLIARLSGVGQASFGKPSLDLLFSSAAKACGAAAIGVVLTGIGRDGAAGSADIARYGGEVIVQDEASSVVWGMPGAVLQAGVAADALPIAGIAARLTQRMPATAS